MWSSELSRSGKRKVKKKTALLEWNRRKQCDCDTIETGFKIPFISTLKSAYFQNNQSATESSHFVQDAIKIVLSSGRISELENHRKGGLNPLTVGKSNSSKLRLVLDLRNFNKHMYKEITKVDD